MVNFIVDLNFNVEAETMNEALILAKEKISNDNDFVNDNITIKGDTIEFLKEYKTLTLKGYVISSDYRKKVLEYLKSISENNMYCDTPSGIANSTGVLINHLSKVLKELTDKNLIRCINPEAKKGRLYCLTEMGEQVQNTIKRRV